MSRAPRGIPGAGSAAGQRPRGAAAVVWVGLVAVLVHTLVIATWVGPQTPVRTMVGEDRLRSYVTPVFDQSWMIFAPTPRRVAVNLEVRAHYVDSATGETVRTDWVDLVDGEDALISGNPFPPRMSLAARRVANTLNSAMGDLNDAQRTLVSGSFTTAVATTALGRRMVDVGDESVPAGTVGTYLRYDAVAAHLATLYASAALPGEELTSVQFRTGLRYVPTWEPGTPRTIDDVEPTWFDYGWRPVAELGVDEVDLFAPYLRMTGDLS